MKKLGIGLALAISLMLSACNFNSSNHHISLQTSDNRNELSFKATYPENRTGEVQSYIEDFFKEDRIFKAITDEKKAEVTLTDGTHFYLNYKPGYLSIDFDRDKNALSSYHRMKKMIAGFGKELKD